MENHLTCHPLIHLGNGMRELNSVFFLSFALLHQVNCWQLQLIIVDHTKSSQNPELELWCQLVTYIPFAVKEVFSDSNNQYFIT